MIETVTFKLYVSNGKSMGGNTTTIFAMDKMYREPLRFYIKAPPDLIVYDSAGVRITSLPFLPVDLGYTRRGDELFAQYPALGVFTDQDHQKYARIEKTWDGKYYILDSAGKYHEAESTLYVEHDGPNYIEYEPPTHYTQCKDGETGEVYYTPSDSGEYIKDYDGEYTTDEQVLDPIVVLLRLQKVRAPALQVNAAVIREDPRAFTKPFEWLHHELTCRDEPERFALAHVQEVDTKAIGLMEVIYQIPKSPDYLTTKIYGSRSGNKLEFSFLPIPTLATENMTKSEALLYHDDWARIDIVELGAPGELITCRHEYQRNRPYITMAWLSFPAITAGEIVERRQHPSGYWSDLEVYIYTIKCEGFVLHNVLPMSLELYDIGEWVSLLKVNKHTATLDRVEQLIEPVSEYAQTYDDYTPMADLFISDFSYRIIGEYVSRVELVAF